MSTNNPMTREQLDAIRERVEVATDGPWVDGQRCVFTEDYEYAIVSDSLVEAPGKEPYGEAVQNPADVALIAHAPQDLSDLLAEVERLSARPAVTDDMVERVAWAMMLWGSHRRTAGDWGRPPDASRELWRMTARVALEAALNPGEGA